MPTYLLKNKVSDNVIASSPVPLNFSPSVSTKAPLPRAQSSRVFSVLDGPRTQPIKVAALSSEPNFKKINEKTTVTAKDQTIFAIPTL